MSKNILRVRLTHNVKQLKKYVDEAILKGAENISFNMDEQNPYFIFSADFTPEQENEYELEKLKKEFNEKLKSLESRKYKTHSFRINQWGLCGKDVDNLVEKFRLTNKIEDCLQPKIKQVITDEYDDFEESKKTVFITELL
tara:strand:- start:62 stop:484 length:423 start_codon:yes stop_codon:yes gene_type:complete